MSEFLHDTEAYKNQNASLYELLQENGNKGKDKVSMRLSKKDKEMMRATQPNFEARKKKSEAVKFSSKPHL